MDLHSILLEVVKILGIGIFLFFFLFFFKKANDIAKKTKNFVTAEHNLNEDYLQKIVKKMIIQFIFIVPFSEPQIEKEVKKLILTDEFKNNIKVL